METLKILQFSSDDGSIEYVVLTQDDTVDPEDHFLPGCSLDQVVELEVVIGTGHTLPLDEALQKQG